jgi:hypothetical protein
MKKIISAIALVASFSVSAAPVATPKVSVQDCVLKAWNTTNATRRDNAIVKCYEVGASEITSAQQCIDLSYEITSVQKQDNFRLSCSEKFLSKISLDSCLSVANEMTSVALQDKTKVKCLEKNDSSITGKKCMEVVGSISNRALKNASLENCISKRRSDFTMSTCAQAADQAPSETFIEAGNIFRSDRPQVASDELKKKCVKKYAKMTTRNKRVACYQLGDNNKEFYTVGQKRCCVAIAKELYIKRNVEKLMKRCNRL